MKKILKIVLIVVGVLIGIVAFDTIQALVFNRSPLLHKREYTCRKVSDWYIDKGIFVNHYHCSNVNETLFKNEKSECTVCYDK